MLCCVLSCARATAARPTKNVKRQRMVTDQEFPIPWSVVCVVVAKLATTYIVDSRKANNDDAERREGGTTQRNGPD